MDNRANIYLCLAKMSGDGMEEKYVKEAFATNWVAPLGPNVDAFEADLESFFGNGRRVVALSSGTAAVHLALLACGVGHGDEVCVQSFTFCASANPVTYLGARPVFIDSERTTWNMDPELLEIAILDRYEVTGKYPKAVIPVALYGMPYDIARISAITEKYGIPIIEDAAEGFGSRFDGRLLGTFGKYGAMSFNGNKMITTSGGGALICPTREDADKVMWYATQARDPYPYYHHSAIGFNYRMSNICAGIGRGQMTVAEDHIAHHRHVQHLYEELLSDVKGVDVHSQPDDRRYDSNFWLCTVCIDPDLHISGEENMSASVTDCSPNNNVEALRVFLLDRKIETRPVWKPMHRQPVYDGFPAYVNGVSESVFKVALCLPAGPCVTDDDVKYIVDSIKSAII